MTTAAGRPSRGMLTIGIVELVTLAVLLVNLADGNNHGIAALAGPVHGTAYLAGLIAGWRSSLPRWRKAITLVPGVGALIAARWQRLLVARAALGWPSAPERTSRSAPPTSSCSTTTHGPCRTRSGSPAPGRRTA